MKLRYSLSILLCVLWMNILSAQTTDDAKTLFDQHQYEQAIPMLQTLYAATPDDVVLNDMLGISLFETDRWMDALPYLRKASAKKVSEATLYLGKLYAMMYRFDDANKEWTKYERANRRQAEKLDRLATFRDEADRWQRSISRTEDVQIIDSVRVAKADFLRAYQLGSSAGTLSSATLSANSNSPLEGTSFTNNMGNKIYASRPTDNNRAELYTVDVLIDGYGNEQSLPEPIRAEGLQAYPFVLSDGLTIYFASTGHESFGGYDLFVSRLNLNTNAYLTPNQLNMPFNSPFNDYMLAIDEEKNVGWFATDRLMPSDTVCVYTFIPNARVALIENPDEQYMASRAMISSIRDTRREGVDYTDILTKARQQRSEKTQKADFSFVINDMATYHTMSDFKTARGRQLFEEYQRLNKQYDEDYARYKSLQDQLASNRNNTSLREQIMSLESSLNSKFTQLNALRKDIRRAELE